ncbi:MAG: mercuric reductase [Nitrospinota bacterium]
MSPSKETREEYQAIVIGTGQAGKPLATALAEGGWKTAVIESGPVGGSCVNVGCTPTKTMVASARVAYVARRAAQYGVDTGAVSVDLARVRTRKQHVVEMFRGGAQRGLERTENLDLIFGQAAFIDSHAVEVKVHQGGIRRLAAEKLFINTGAAPVVPPIPGLDALPFLDSSSIMDLDTLPEHLLVIGGGYIGLEFGQMFRRFGSQVTIVQRGDQLLSREDPDVAEEVRKILTEDGIEVFLKAEVLGARLGSDTGAHAFEIQSPSGQSGLRASHVLVAVGRAPATARLNLGAAGIATDESGFITVNDRLETNVPGVYALGDVKGGPAFTHISYDDYRIVRANLLDGGGATMSGRLVPYTVFLDPQLGRVGLTEREARAQGWKIRVATLPMSHVARALEVDETRGFMKAIVDAETDQILGCAILGIEGGEVMSVIQVAMMGNLPYTRLRDGVFAHPTLAESLNNLFMAMEA